jgi:hypothetical protein
MPLDGHSAEADALADHTTIAKVQVVIIGLLNDYGPTTDDTLIDRYDARAAKYPGIPKVTPQRIRTARAELARKGLVGAASTAGTSRYGNPATQWTLT